MRRLLHLEPTSEYLPWFWDRQHAGFSQQWGRNVTLVTLKGAGHMAPEDKRGPALAMFSGFIEGKL
jgi:serine carboxypeptidase-like clade I